LQIQPVSW